MRRDHALESRGHGRGGLARERLGERPGDLRVPHGAIAGPWIAASGRRAMPDFAAAGEEGGGARAFRSVRAAG